MKIIEVRVVEQQWYETEFSKTGWDSYGWVFKDSGSNAEVEGWTIIEHLDTNKHGFPTLGIAEKETKINE